MEGFRAYLESASINGLNHIAATRKWARVFWILIVATGFILATFLTWESFQSWTDNPVRTTTRTLPMSELKFPKVTVCPPKNTFTDLNYDLIITENVTLSNDQRNELYKYVVELIDEHLYMDPWNRMHEENRFYNWYSGFTPIYKEPYYDFDNYYDYTIVTSAPSGVITSDKFGEKFQPNLVEKKIFFEIKVFPPRSVRYNSNVTLHVELEKLSMTDLRGGWDDCGLDQSYHIETDPDNLANYIMLDGDSTIVHKSYTPPSHYGDGGKRLITFNRDVSEGELSGMDMDMMPGFRLSWYYTGMEFTPDPLMEFPIFSDNYEYSKYNIDFVRKVFFYEKAFWTQQSALDSSI